MTFLMIIVIILIATIAFFIGGSAGMGVMSKKIKNGEPIIVDGEVYRAKPYDY